MNVVVHPGTSGRVTYRGSRRPWAEVLEQLLAPNGYAARIQGNVVLIGRPEQLGENRPYVGKPINLEYVSRDLVDALREIAANGRATVEVPEGVAGRVTLKLDDVPWDQAFDLLAGVNGLTWTRAGDVIRLAVREQPR
jgi:type II secretory pathway component HofQ